MVIVVSDISMANGPVNFTCIFWCHFLYYIIIELSHVLILLPNTGDGLILLLLTLQQYRNEFYAIPITVLLLCA